MARSPVDLAGIAEVIEAAAGSVAELDAEQRHAVAALLRAVTEALPAGDYRDRRTLDVLAAVAEVLDLDRGSGIHETTV